MNRGAWIDDAAVLCSVLVLTVPVALFLCGWTKIHIAAAGAALMGWLTVVAFRELRPRFTVRISEHPYFFLFALLCLAGWCVYSGIGGFAYQTFDFIVRNPTYSDLCHCSWPVCFPTAGQRELVQEMLGDAESCSYVYYYTWWLPAAFLVKVFHLGVHAAGLLLLGWSILYVFLIFYCICNVLGRCSFLALSSLILFGGMDYWMCVIRDRSFAFPKTADWWAGYFSYSSNTTQMYNIFHACTPVWLAVCLIMLMEDNTCKGAVGALCFAYNPFATLGMVPLTAAACLDVREGSIAAKIRRAASPLTVGTVLLMLFVYGSFYLRTLRNAGPSRYEGIVFRTWPGGRIVLYYAAFLFAEVLVYYLAMGAQARKSRFYLVCLIALCLIPVYRTGYYNDFSLKTSIPFLFALMLSVLKQWYMSKMRGRRTAILLVLLMGYMTSAVELNRNISHTGIPSILHPHYTGFESFAGIDTGDDLLDELFAKQYLAADTGESFWEKYIGK